MINDGKRVLKLVTACGATRYLDEPASHSPRLVITLYGRLLQEWSTSEKVLERPIADSYVERRFMFTHVEHDDVHVYREY